MKTIVPVPKESIGQIIGKGGATIKGIQKTSGAGVKLDGNRNEVIITGTDNQVATAKLLILDIVSNSVKVYAHPEKAFNLLENVELSKVDEVILKNFEGVMDESGISKSYFIPTFLSNEKSKGKIESKDLEHSKQRSFFHKGEKMEVLKEVLQMSVKELGDNRLHAFGFTIGSTTLYESKKQLKTRQSLQTLMNSKIGIDEDLKCKFHPVVGESDVERIDKFLLNKNFTKERRHWKSIHFVDQKKKERFNLIFEYLKDDKYDVSCYSGKTSHYFVNFMYIPNFKFDSRLFHRTDQYDDMKDEQVQKMIAFLKKGKDFGIEDLERLQLKNITISTIRDQYSDLYTNEDFKIYMNKVLFDDDKYRYEFQLFDKKFNEMKEKSKFSHEDLMKKVLLMNGFILELLGDISK